jgi:thiol-disulfide isomerase/thioredoxin
MKSSSRDRKATRIGNGREKREGKSVKSKSLDSPKRQRARQRARRRRVNAMRRAAKVVAAITVVAAIVGIIAVLGRGQSGKVDPQNFDLPRLNGEGRIRLEDFRGKPTVINFFASWCTSCREELPGFAKVSSETKGTINFVGVNTLETGDGMRMAKEFGIDWWPIASDVGGAQRSGLHDALGARGMPLTVFYDAEGRIVDKVNGVLPERALRQKLRDLYGIG